VDVAEMYGVSVDFIVGREELPAEAREALVLYRTLRNAWAHDRVPDFAFIGKDGIRVGG
jgi:hypothetical protein